MKEQEYIVKMRVILEGAEAIVLASSVKEAREKTDAGQWEDFDSHIAEIVDWEVTSVEANDEDRELS